MRTCVFLPAAALSAAALAACERPQAAPLDTAAPAAAATATAAPISGGGSTASATAVARGPGPLALPTVFPRTCEGEDCEVEFSAFACAGVELRSAAADTAPIVARISKGDTVNVRSIDLHLVEPGRVVLRRDFALDWVDDGEVRRPATDTLRFAAGDTVYLLHYDALGSWTWWHGGRVQSGNEFWAGPVNERLGGVTRSDDSSVAVGLSHPRRQYWWRVEQPSGTSGWWHADTLHSLLSISWMRRWESGCPPWK